MDLIETVYQFFPKGINGLDEKYFETQEINRLREKMSHDINIRYSLWTELIKQNSKDDFLIVDMTNFLLGSPSYACEIKIRKPIDKEEIFQLKVSIISEYYYLIKIDNGNFDIDEDLQDFLDNVEKIMNTKQISTRQLEIVVPEVSFETILFGQFKIKDALF